MLPLLHAADALMDGLLLLPLCRYAFRLFARFRYVAATRRRHAAAAAMLPPDAEMIFAADYRCHIAAAALPRCLYFRRRRYAAAAIALAFIFAAPPLLR